MWCYGTSCSCGAMAQGLDWTLCIISIEQYFGDNTPCPSPPAFFTPIWQKKSCFPWKSPNRKAFPMLVKAGTLALGNVSRMWFEVYVLPFLSLACLDLPWCCWPSDSHDPLKRDKAAPYTRGHWLVRKSSSLKNVKSPELQAMETRYRGNISNLPH